MGSYFLPKILIKKYLAVAFFFFLVVSHADISPLLAKRDDPKMEEDPGVCAVVRQLDQACREAGFFYVVSISKSMCFLLYILLKQKFLRVASILVKWHFRYLSKYRVLGRWVRLQVQEIIREKSIKDRVMPMGSENPLYRKDIKYLKCCCVKK